MTAAARIPDLEENELKPIALSERLASLDILRGVSLFGVLMVNLLTCFRVSIFTHILSFHTDSGFLNHGVDLWSAGLLETKAVTLFSLLFGIGIAVQNERASARSFRAGRFLMRRFLVLLAFGLCHMFLLSNVDILSLYAICAMMLIPFLGMTPAALAALGFGVVTLSLSVDTSFLMPSAKIMSLDAMQAGKVYASGGFMEILFFRWKETWSVILPLLLGWLPRTIGLMLIGMATWRAEIIKDPRRHSRFLWAIAITGGVLGGGATVLRVFAQASGREIHFPVPPLVQDAYSYTPLAFAYGAALLLTLRSKRFQRLMMPFAALGRMALSNYLAQSMIFGFIFYGYGLGYFGKLSPACAAAIGIAVYLAQIAFSMFWLRKFRFGPFEWLWRSLTYGRVQALH